MQSDLFCVKRWHFDQVVAREDISGSLLGGRKARGVTISIRIHPLKTITYKKITIRYYVMDQSVGQGEVLT